MSKGYALGKSAVIGAGLMGGQISVVLAMSSEETVLMSRHQETLDRALRNIHRYVDTLHRHSLLKGDPGEIMGSIRITRSLGEAASGADFVVEAVHENLDVKRSVFVDLDRTAPADTILASNTSSIPITKIAEPTRIPERVVGSHFVQPAHITPTVEVVMGSKTSDEAVKRCCEIWKQLGKIPLLIKTDIPGFLINRLQHAIIKEAVSLLTRGVASAEDIDTAVALGLAPRFTTAGPLEQRDINGLSMHFNVASLLWKDLSGWEEPLAYVKAKVERGELGLDVGKGYYDWSGIDPVAVRREKDEALIGRTQEVLAWWNRRMKGVPLR